MNKNSNVTEGKPVIERFRAYIRDNNSAGDIVGFIHMESARLMSQMSIVVEETAKFIEEKAEEYSTFYGYFMDNYYNATCEAIAKEWGSEDNGPFLFDFCQECETYLENQMTDEIYNSMPDSIQNEVDSLLETLSNIDKKKRLTFMFPDAGIVTDWDIPANLSEEDAIFNKREVFNRCVMITANSGMVYVRTFESDDDNYEMTQPHEIFAITITPSGIWHPVSKEALFSAHTTTPEGVKLRPEENATYTEICRETF